MILGPTSPRLSEAIKLALIEDPFVRSRNEELGNQDTFLAPRRAAIIWPTPDDRDAQVTTGSNTEGVARPPYCQYTLAETRP